MQKEYISVVVWPKKGDLGNAFSDMHSSPSFVASLKYRMRMKHPVSHKAATYVDGKGNSSSANWETLCGM